MELQLIDYQKTLYDLLGKLENTVSPYVSSSEEIKELLQKIKELYEHKIESVKPQIMVYGIYNAGKSSIINELIKSDKAEVADKPMTDAVTYYEWNGYEIADTPGVGAPIEHENVTMEHLKKADVVLFVMSSTGANEKKENYIRMKDIVEAGKKIIIVLNDKNGDLGRNDEQLELIKLQVAKNMQAVGIPNVNDKYYIVVVNAARAKKGRTENKVLLVEKSNINELGRVILSELKQTSSYEVIRNATHEIENNINEISYVLENSEEKAELAKINNILTMLRERKRLIRTSVGDYIRVKASNLQGILPDKIWANKDSQEAVNAAISEEVQKIVEYAQKELELQIGDLQDDLQTDVADLIDVVRNAKVNAKNTVINCESLKDSVNSDDISEAILPEEDIVGFDSDKVLDRMKDLLLALGAKDVSQLTNVVTTTMADMGLGSLAKIAGEELITKFATTQIGKSIINFLGSKVVGSVVPIIGQAWLVYDMLKMFLGRNSDVEKKQAELNAKNEFEQQKAAAEMRARQDLQQKCIYLSDDIADSLVHAMSDVINEIIGKIEVIFEEELKTSNKTINQKMTALASIRKIANEYNSFYISLEGR